MPGMPVAIQGVVRKLRGVVNTNPPAPDLRISPYGDQYVMPVLAPLQASALERSYYVGQQIGTRNTGITLTVATGVTYLSTQALVLVFNGNPVGGPDVILDFVQIKQDAVSTASTFWHIYHALDDGNRYSSGGAEMQMMDADWVKAPGVVAYSGVVVTSAVTGSVRDVGYNLIQNGVGVAQSIYTVRFGRQEGAPAGTFTTPTTGVAQSTFDAPPIVIPPQKSYVMNEFQTARTAAATGEIIMGLHVR